MYQHRRQLSPPCARGVRRGGCCPGARECARSSAPRSDSRGCAPPAPTPAGRSQRCCSTWPTCSASS
jgi:hypothetical protein